MPKIRPEMAKMVGAGRAGGMVVGNAQVNGLGADDATVALVDATVEQLVAMSGVNEMPEGDPRKAVEEMVRRLKDDTYPRSYTYYAGGIALGLGLLVGWALAG